MDGARIHGRRGERLVASPLRWALVPLWAPYRLAVALRNLAYDRGWKPVARLPAPVISVGNLTAGGTGKTPLVAALGALLRARGRRPAVLSRGYGARAGEANDEARSLDLPGYCDPDRRRGAARALADGADVLLLDDGFQHRRVHRDLDLLCLDATRPFGRTDGRRGAVLPLGLLREGVRGLGRADAFVVTRSDQVPPEALAALRRHLEPHGRPIFLARHAPVALADPRAGTAEDPAVLAGRAVLAISGLGNPLGFERSLAELGADPLAVERFADHHAYTASEAGALAEAAASRGACLVTTAKDAVKLLAVLPPEAPLRVLEVELRVDDPPGLEALLDRCLDAAQGLSSPGDPPAGEKDRKDAGAPAKEG